jgi:hypothetical protein
VVSTFQPPSQHRQPQQALNNAKKEQLNDQYGIAFTDPDSELPPDVEAEWLNHVEEFERQYASCKRITVGGYCGNPTLRPVAEIPDEDIASELAALLHLLEANNVHIHFLAGVDDREAYRFITEDLFGEEMDDIRIEGMTCNFIYEEFYPNDEYDAAQDARWFLRDLFERDAEHLWSLFASDDLQDSNGRPLEFSRIKQQIHGFYQRVISFDGYSVDNANCTVNEGVATYEADISWSGVQADSPAPVQREGRVRIRLKQGDYYGWKIQSVALPGMEESA